MDKQRLFLLRTMPYEEYLKTPEWLAKRQQVLERDEGCRNCNAQENLEVHHRTYARRGYEDLRDLTVLCESCHEHFHKKKSQADIMGRTYVAPIDPDKHAKYGWEEFMLGLLMHYVDLWPYVRGILNEGDFLGEETRRLYLVLSSADDPESVEIPSELAATVEKVNKRVEQAQIKVDEDETKLVKEAIRCATRLRRTHLLETQTELTYQIDAAVRGGDQEEIQRLSQQLSGLQRELRTLYSATHLQG